MKDWDQPWYPSHLRTTPYYNNKHYFPTPHAHNQTKTSQVCSPYTISSVSMTRNRRYVNLPHFHTWSTPYYRRGPHCSYRGELSRSVGEDGSRKSNYTIDCHLLHLQCCNCQAIFLSHLMSLVNGDVTASNSDLDNFFFKWSLLRLAWLIGSFWIPGSTSKSYNRCQISMNVVCTPHIPDFDSLENGFELFLI